MEINKAPPVDLVLLQWLEKNCPARCPKPGQPLDEVFFYSGKRSMVELLRFNYERQNKI